MDNPITLDEDELEFVASKNTHKNKLAFAVILKYFQNTGCYPVDKNSISLDLINSLANQLNISASFLNQFDWAGRTAERFRHAIRNYLGFRKATLDDSKLLKAWLIENSLPEAPSIKLSIAQAYHYLYTQKIEPFTEKELERHVRSAAQAYEQQLFSSIYQQLSVATLNAIDTLLIESQEIEEDAFYGADEQIQFRHLKKEMPGARLKHVEFEIQKLNCIRHLGLANEPFKKLSRKLIKKYHDRIMAEPPSDVLRHPHQQKYAMVALFLYCCSQRITDDLANLFIQLIQKMKTSAESFINKKIVSEVKHVNGKFDILYSLAKTSLSHPEGIIREKIYPAVGKEMLSDLIQEMNYKGKWYQSQVQFKIQSLYSYSHRKALLNLLAIFTFQANTVGEQNFLQAIELIKTYRDDLFKYFPAAVKVPIKNIITSEWQSNIIENQEGIIQVNRMAYEIALLEELRRKLRCKTIWITGAYHYRNPEEDLPQDFDVNREAYFKKLDLPLDAKAFIAPLKAELQQQLQALNDTLPNNDKVKIISKHPGRIKLSPSVAQNEPINLEKLHQQIQRRWPSINLIDILKEVDLQIGFTNQFYTVASRENIPQESLQKRLLLCLYGIGSNMGLKRVSAANDDVNYSDLRYIKRRFINVANVRAAIAEVINKILEIRDPVIWGDATTGCACDSTKVSAWDQNLLTEWHTRYKGRGVMIYWHVDRKAACIYSQLKTCSSSEVGAMIKGILRHCTKMDMDQLYVDTHGQSTLGFAVSHLLHFDLLPRLKNLHQQKLYYCSPKDKNNYPDITAILKETINWNLIESHYNEIVKHMAALKTDMVEPEVLIKRFSHDNYAHPVYKALTEIGKVVKTLFLCRYLTSEALRIEIHEALNVVERLNSIMGFMFYGKLGEIATNDKNDLELAVVCLHLLQVCMVYINTIMIQEILAEPGWMDRLEIEDKRALSPLIHAHINPYGLFPLNLQQRLKLLIPKEAINRVLEAEGIAA